MPQKSTGPRRRTAVACDRCRRRKIRCIASEFSNQPCLACQKAHAECHFSVSSWRSSRKRSTPFHCPPHTSTSLPSPPNFTPAAPTSTGSPSYSSLSYPQYSGDPTSLSAYPLASSAPSKLSSYPSSSSSFVSMSAPPAATTNTSFSQPPHNAASFPPISSRKLFYPYDSNKNTSGTFPSYNDNQPPSTTSFFSSPLVHSSLYMSPPSRPIDHPVSPTTVPMKPYASSSSSPPPSLSASISSVSSVPGFVDHDPLQPSLYQKQQFPSYLDSTSSPSTVDPSTPNSNLSTQPCPSSTASTTKFPQDGYLNKPFDQLPMLSDLSLPEVQRAPSPKQDSCDSLQPSKNQLSNSITSAHSQLLGDSDFDYSSYLTDSSDTASPVVQTDELASQTFTVSSNPIGSIDPLSLEIDQFTNLHGSASSNNPLETSFSQFSDSNPCKSAVLPWTMGSPPLQSLACPDLCGSLDESFRCLDFTNENLWWENIDSEKTTPLKTEKPKLSPGGGLLDDMSHFLKNLDD
ncbi:transcription factor [Schizosaccharomyces cryophilus OY26]|uniref:Transcription factor n=1 Tax=Schizosaccharomyces cryophilus (strain OY26 / ATCC MYA-4695 / CBS 11777 / NBRC 106824 / NRRL Y48691) TaxID=653667 RepID=S9VVM9_SCHCR|nr:transcription factor [Schizosaccharomyces cryophilus OY26]EPY50180.1 transcription factor [Schizosaccharomyces cryophilus OY26]